MLKKHFLGGMFWNHIVVFWDDIFCCPSPENASKTRSVTFSHCVLTQLSDSWSRFSFLVLCVSDHSSNTEYTNIKYPSNKYALTLFPPSILLSLFYSLFFRSHVNIFPHFSLHILTCKLLNIPGFKVKYIVIISTNLSNSHLSH